MKRASQRMKRFARQNMKRLACARHEALPAAAFEFV